MRLAFVSYFFSSISFDGWRDGTVHEGVAHGVFQTSRNLVNEINSKEMGKKKMKKRKRNAEFSASLIIFAHKKKKKKKRKEKKKKKRNSGMKTYRQEQRSDREAVD
jgi:hypothetical protein